MLHLGHCHQDPLPPTPLCPIWTMWKIWDPVWTPSHLLGQCPTFLYFFFFEGIPNSINRTVLHSTNHAGGVQMFLCPWVECFAAYYFCSLLWEIPMFMQHCKYNSGYNNFLIDFFRTDQNEHALLRLVELRHRANTNALSVFVQSPTNVFHEPWFWRIICNFMLK